MVEQILRLTAASLKSLGSRLGTSLIIVVGIGGVVAVLIGLLAMASGFRAALEATGRADRAVVLRTGASDEVTSWLTMNEVAIVSELEGADPVSGELFVVADLLDRATGRPGVAIARGVTPAAFTLRPELVVVAGRQFRPGHDEVIAGVDAVAGYAGLDIGDTVGIRDHRLTVVGQFRGAGVHDSEIWMDLPAAQAAYRRSGAVSSVRLRFTEPEAMAEAMRRVEADPRLKAVLMPEPQFYAAQSERRAELIQAFAYLVAGIMAAGAAIAAYSTMHAAVGSRALEVATLRALGFGPAPVMVSILLESMLLALVGGALGGALVYLLYDGYGASTLESGSMSQVAFQFRVTPASIGRGLIAALLLGLGGGLVPALQAARAPIASALRGH